jgi:PAS domain S-box-containing protein
LNLSKPSRCLPAVPALADITQSQHRELEICMDLSTSAQESAEKLHQSEERFRQLVEGAKDYAIVMLNPAGNVVSWNTGAQLINGYEEAEILGQNLSIFYTGSESGQAAHQEHLNIARTEGRFETDGWRLRKSGEVFWANVVITRLNDLSGALSGFSKVTRDITERKKSETQLLESEARTRAILAAAVDAILTIDEFGSIESLNHATEKMFGYAAQELIGQNVRMLMPAPYRQEHDGYLNNHMLTGQKKIIGIGREVVGLRKNGHTFPMDLAVSKVESGGRRVFTGIVRDISERKASESQLRESEARTRAILAAAVDAIITIDEFGKIESLNSATEKLFGYTAEQMVGQNVKMLMPSPYRNEHDGYLSNHMRTGEKKIIGIGREVTGRRQNGETFPMELAVSTVETGGRKVFTGIVRDITERKRSESQLIESEARTRAILAAAVDAIIIIDASGTIESMNTATEKLFGYTADEMLGNNVRMLMPAPYRAEHDGYLHNYIGTGQKKIIGIGREVTGLRKNGDTFPMDLAVSEVAMGGRQLFTGIVRDITERKKSEVELVKAANALRQRNEDLLRSNQELDSFAYIASHDLKEPLRGIHNYATFLIEDYHDQLDDEGKDKLDTLKRLTQRLDGLLDSLLELSRLGRVDFTPGAVDLDQIVHETLESLSITLQERKTEIRLPAPLPIVLGDAVLLGEVFRNLVTNAMKYNEKSERSIEIGCEPVVRKSSTGDSSTTGARAALYVRDNGIGIPEQHLESVFRIFKRLHAREAFGGGTGVGLAITKKVIERHGGDIWIESTPDVGTTIYFTVAGLHGVRA